MATILGHRDFTDVERGDDGDDTNTNTTNDAEHYQLLEVGTEGASYGRGGEENGGQNHGQFTAQFVTEHT